MLDLMVGIKGVMMMKTFTLSVQEIMELKEENECLKEESRLFTLEAKKLVAQYSAKLEWYKQTLQDIKNIAETCTSGISCNDCPFTEDCVTDTDTEALGVCKLILQKITKAEEE